VCVCVCLFVRLESGNVYISGKGRTSSKGDSSVLGPDVVDEQLSHPKRLAFTFPHQIKQIQLGNYHALALSSTGQVWSW
jgi:alpha-tubulin suppressor-like RCC1 family protein